jgi:hypothetical protein
LFPVEGLVLDPPRRAKDLAAFPYVPAADRWLLVTTPVEEFGQYRTVIWDLYERRMCGDLPGVLGAPFITSADGRFVVTEPRPDDEPGQWGVWDAAAGRTVFRIPAGGERAERLDLSADGAVLAVIRQAGVGVNELEAQCWSVTTGQQLAHVPNVRAMALLPDGRTLVTLSGTDSVGADVRVTIWDLLARRPRAEVTVQPGDESEFGPTGDPVIDGRTLALPFARSVSGPLPQLAPWIGPLWPFPTGRRQFTTGLLDVRAGRWLGELPCRLNGAAWLPDGTALMTLDDEGLELRVWDIPPRKPLSWFLIASALLALPLAWLARRRVRRLRPVGVGSTP